MILFKTKCEQDEARYEHKILVEKPEERSQFGRCSVNVDGRIILIWILRQQNVIIWTELNFVKLDLAIIADIIKN